jgi:hypothetical protein
VARIQLGGAGGAPTNNFIKSLRNSNRNDYLIGTSCVPSDLFLADVDEKHVVPSASASDYAQKMLIFLAKIKPDFLHLQHDYEVRAISRMRKKVQDIGVKLFLPSEQAVEDCVNKERSYVIWKQNGVRVPKTMLIKNPKDLTAAFASLGEKIWLRAIEGGGGFGALPTDDYEFAKNWIERFQGWGIFTAAELLTNQTITWQSIWYEGVLVVAQTRRRRSWNFGDRTLSGVTGITGVGETCSIKEVDELAMNAIQAISASPHGIFCVDMTYDFAGKPNVTEINIGRFFTTHYFFTQAGLNFPEIYCNIALDNKFPVLAKKINPLPDGLIWIRGMDVEPILTTLSVLENLREEIC